MKKIIVIVFTLLFTFMFEVFPVNLSCSSRESGKDRLKNIPERQPQNYKKEKTELAETESGPRKVKENQYIKIDKGKVPIRISEGIHTPDDFLKSIGNKTFNGNIISVNFQDVDIREVIRRFSKLLGYSIRIDPAISGKVSYWFKNAPWNLVLSSFLKANRLEIIFDGFQLNIRKKKIETRGTYIYFFLLIPTLLISFLLVKKILTKPRTKRASPSLNISPHKIEEYAKRIAYLMDVEKIYKEEDFSLKKLADILSLQPYVVSRIINEKLKHSFPGLLNHHRIEEAKRMLTADDKTINILNIAFEVGFNSKTAFNRIFKKQVGITPSEYRKKYQL